VCQSCNDKLLHRPWANSRVAHRTLRCLTPDGPVPPPEQEISQSEDFVSRPSRALFTVWCAPDSPVHPRTEGNQSLPNRALTTSKSLGAIKGTPSRMEQYTKHPLNILHRLDFASTHSFHCYRYLINSLSACCCFDSGSCVCFYSLPYSCGLLVINFVRVRDSKLWRFLTKEESCGTQV
jgi:hypothetical protein